MIINQVHINVKAPQNNQICKLKENIPARKVLQNGYLLLNFASTMTYGLNNSPAKRRLIPSTTILVKSFGFFIFSNAFLRAIFLNRG